ncbi:MAG: pyridoxamine 5'-phosphate oxidase family protein [Rhodoferax sp.]|nr:pyridoxamine 5'-phosphate oxidase family protein [Rhodoferax sp.]
MTDNDSSREQLWSLIKDIKFAMFTTRHGNGHLHARPMTTQNQSVDEDDRLWFFMSRRDSAVADLAGEAEVNLSYADTDEHSYVSVSGKAKAVVDLVKTRSLWSKAADVWFPGGAEDPDLALVEVQITHAHYWNTKDNKMTQLYKLAKAVVTGETPKHMGDSVEVRTQ